MIACYAIENWFRRNVRLKRQTCCTFAQYLYTLIRRTPTQYFPAAVVYLEKPTHRNRSISHYKGSRCIDKQKLETKHI